MERLIRGMVGYLLRRQGTHMPGIHRIAIACLITALPVLCVAGDEVTYTFECDTPAGHFSYWTRSVSSTEIEVSGNVTLNAMLTDKKWSPTVLAAFRGDKAHPKQYGVHVWGIAKTPEFLFVELLKVGGSDRIGLGVIPNRKEPIPFSLRLEASGLLKVTVAGSDASTELGGDFKPKSFELSCSTGDFEFKDVTVKEKGPGPN